MTDSSSTTSTSDQRWGPRLWGTLIVLCGALFLDALDISMVGVALPSIRDDLGMSTSALQWVVSGYVLGYGGLLLLGGRAADLLGRRRVLLAALAVFAIGSLLGGLVDNAELLIAARFVKGVAAAFTAPAALSIITTTFAEGPSRNRALSILTVCAASGFSLGLVFSGLLTEIGWRWPLLLPAPVAAVVLVAAIKLVPDDGRPARDGSSYDIAGATTSTAALLLLVYTIVQAPEVGWASAATLVGFGLAVALGAAFVVIERRTSHPLVRLGIFRSGPLVRANLGAMVFFGSYVGFQFVVMQYMQRLLGWTALQTALAFLPAAVIVLASSTKMDAVVSRFGTARLILTGFGSLVVAYAFFVNADVTPNVLGVVLPCMVLLGVSCALCFTSLNIQATAGVAAHEQGLAGGLINTSLQVGGAIGLAVVTAVITANEAAEGAVTTPAELLAGYTPALAVVAGIAALGVVVSLTGIRDIRRSSAPHQAEQEPVPAG
ncbi:MFS transporter [Actinokineospora iranica]|uniref:Drug resistance transporter, EmrB/QacA subfamily n=1 Tax=Actinokineospora iranica TaxID=1271860 RepID=A0A1G6U2F6_9PSEU|nr:MFS transporter [Actinokineospora iranica]SDD34856.1 drug resistance transporter, EmrB/QacA subfamily [Actinokineospora iranica]